MTQELRESVCFINNKVSFNGETAIILGSGLGDFANNLSKKNSISFSDIPSYPTSNVRGHNGELVFGKINGKEILVSKGRSHLYEGYSKEVVSYPVLIFKELGIKNLIITNSAGSLKRKTPPGTLMIIKGHLDMTFQKSAAKPTIISNSKYYSPSLIEIAQEIGIEKKIALESGVYCWTLGPMYETAEEINFFKSLNGSAVGMSTAPEIEMGGKIGLKVLTVSTLTNYAAGVSKNQLSHDEVLLNANNAKDKILSLLKNILKRI
tara:strand:+ start:230 stop:1021 length:792 start_codon:yes stop_codon:yes gene_type:complete